MNENPPSQEPVPPAASPASNAEEPAAPASVAETVAENRSDTRTNRTAIYVVLIALAVGLGALWWMMQNEIGSLRQDVSRRLQTGESQVGETRALAQSMQEQLKEMQNRLNVLETKQLEAQGQWAALEQLYQDLSKTRDDWVLAEIEQILSTASQQLQLAGNVRGAIIALQNADARLAQYDNAQFMMIRRAIAQDLEILQALPAVDLTGIVLRLDSVIGRIDNMPLLADEKAPIASSEPKDQRFADRPPQGGGEGVQAEGVNAWLARLEQAWHSLTHELWTEVRQIVQVRKVGTPDALLVSPSEAYFARENLKLRLLTARLALLARNEAAFRNDLAAAQEIIVKYFDTRAKQTQTVLELIKQIQASDLLTEMPTLANSLNAIRSHKTSQ